MLAFDGGDGPIEGETLGPVVEVEKAPFDEELLAVDVLSVGVPNESIQAVRIRLVPNSLVAYGISHLDHLGSAILEPKAALQAAN